MSKRDLLNLPDDLEGNLRKLLHTPPPPHDIPGSRKAEPKPPAKPKARKRRRPKVTAPVGTYAYESAPVLDRVSGTRKRRKKR